MTLEAYLQARSSDSPWPSDHSHPPTAIRPRGLPKLGDCDACEGQGRTKRPAKTLGPDRWVPCRKCAGTGKVIAGVRVRAVARSKP